MTENKKPETQTKTTSHKRGHGQRRGPKRNGPNDRGNRRRTPGSTRKMVRKKSDAAIPPIGDNLRIIPLGGVEEVGRNMTVVEFKNDIIVIDAGFKFTDEDTPGIDYILPNTKYLEERKDKIRGIVITHGHLDHIGSIPYIMNKIGNPPIYTREFGAFLIKKRQEEFPHLPELDIRVVGKDDGAISITKELKVRFFGLTHSIPDSTGIIIETPYGDIVNTGDVRVENEDGVPVDEEVEQYKIFKDRNVLLLTMDSTGIEKAGWSLSEKLIIKNIEETVKTSSGRIIIATFASQVERVIAFIEIAKRYNRKVVIDGRSMKNNVGIVKHLKLTDLDHLVPIEDVDKYPPHKIMVIATGAQGEEFAALMRISNKTHKYIKLNNTDTVVLSSSIIPGNEKAITELKNNLYRHDPRVLTYMDSDVHTSGHGKRAELEWIHRQIPYKFFMPVHGHHFMLKMHAELAEKSIGTPRENIVVPDNGSIIEIPKDRSKIEKIKAVAPSEDMIVEGFTIGDVQDVVIRDRKLLAEDGMFVIIATINVKTGKLRKSPDIISRGFVYLRESQDLLQQTRVIIKKTIEKSTSGVTPINFDYVKSNITDSVSRFLFQKTAKRPIVIPVVLGI